MKKFLFVLLILLLGFGGYIIYTNYINKGIPKLTLEEEIVNILRSRWPEYVYAVLTNRKYMGGNRK